MLSANNLDKHLSELAEKGWTILNLAKEPTHRLLEACLKRQSQMKPALISQSAKVESEIRSDSTFWLENKEGTLYPIELETLDFLESLRIELKEYFRISISEFECHYSRYENGQKYARHSDITSVNNRRLFSFVIYLNPDWQEGDGGEFVGYSQNNTVVIKEAPRLGKMLLFRSDIEHEVLSASKKRVALTGWMRK